MKTIRTLYSYYPGSGLERLHVESCTALSVTVPRGLSGEVIRRTEIDAPGARCFTTPTAAIDAFIVKAETALADPTRCKKADRSGWLKCLAAAKKLLREQKAK